MITTANLGYPRFGAKRELKRALESFWSGKSGVDELVEACRQLRRTHWQIQQQARLDVIPSNDFSFYDGVLDTIAMLGAVPDRYGWTDERVDFTTYFAMARGRQQAGVDVPALEMTKWFDTNYHYIVPEFTTGKTFCLGSTKPVDEFLEAKALGIHTRPVLLGPISFLLLGKSEAGLDPFSLLAVILPIYGEILQRLAAAGADWVQIDEPCLLLDLDSRTDAAYEYAYKELAAASSLKLMLTTYFGALRENLDTALQLPVAGLHIDLVRAPEQLAATLPYFPVDKVLSLGVIDGRNIWRTDLDAVLRLLQPALDKLGADRLQLAPSCSLLYTPHDLNLEPALDDELRCWLAFARQKLDELALLKRAINEGEAAVAAELQATRAALASRRTSSRTQNPALRQRMATVTPAMLHRQSPYNVRQKLQQERLKLPPLPTTTIGSFPQTQAVRSKRNDFRAGRISEAEYEQFLQEQTADAVRRQEGLGLDVLVHGEFERTDMVEYFGEQLTGIALTVNGWVQSYGSRGVRPPIIYGDVTRPAPMTVDWTTYAQSLTQRPMKGMLTGPVTILEWSFVRDDHPRAETCRQIALAIRDEVIDLETAGISVIQVDEPALREGLPLRRSEWADYLRWAVDCFRLATAGVRDETQIHTHMCYAEFNDIIEAIGELDADVISIESSRSKMELLNAFVEYHYHNAIGPGVYDIHSPRVPTVAEMTELLAAAAAVISPAQLWVNPDCGLKTRRWEEVVPALQRMVAAAQAMRERLAQASTAHD
jgi:5-methyltetrahydropteroyltriglutamate--homocysteine methyltransferase